MYSTQIEETKKKILKLLHDRSVVVIQGEAGIGKTWMAREVSESPENKKLSCDNIWVSCTNKHDIRCIFEDIVHQFSRTPPGEEWDKVNWDTDEKTRSCNFLKDKVLKIITEKISSEDGGKKFLLIILDDFPTEMKEAEITTELLMYHGQKVKFLITRRDCSGNDTIGEAEGTVKIEPSLSKDLSTLLRELVDGKVREFANFEKLSTAIAERSRGLPAVIVMIAAALNSIARNKFSCWNLDSALQEVASGEAPPEDVTKMLHFCLDMLPSTEMANCFWYSREFFPRHGGIHYNELIANWILEGYFSDIERIENAYAKGHCVLIELLDRGLLKILQNDIVFIEGLALKTPDHRYGGYARTSSLGLACAFEDGQWEGSGRIVWTDGIIQTLCRSKDPKISKLLLDESRLSREVPETFSRSDSMMQMLSRSKDPKITTLLLDGSRLSREFPETFEPMQDLKILALFKPRFKTLPLPLLKMGKLLVLVLRGSDMLENINEIGKLKALLILEISGASSLKMIPDDTFEHVVHMRTLNLSSIPIKNLPSSFANLSGLRWLILRDCPCLEALPNLTTLGNLEMLDASGTTNLKKIPDKCFAPLRKLQYVDLSRTQIVRLPFICHAGRLTRLLLRGCSCLFRLPSLPRSLQILDLSDSATTEIEPGLKATIKESSGDVTDLRHLNLSGCGELRKLLPTKAFEKLELLDVSNAVNLKEIEDESFDHLKDLKVLNLSNNKVDTLPSLHKLGNLRQLLLRDCKSLKRLPSVEGLVRLKELDLSGASSLEEIGPESPDCEKFDLPNLQKLLLAGCDHLKKLPPLNTLEKLDILNLSGCILLAKIPDDSFEHLPCLHLLDLSETKIEPLPSVAKLGNLHHLILRDCHLLSITGLESLTKLQELDLCGTSSLGEFKAKCLAHMHQLQILKLSGTKVDELPFISNLTNLTQLSLSGCSGFTELPYLDELTKLKDLDLAGTDIKSLSSIKTLGNLQRLSVRNCSSLELEKLPPLEPHSCVEVLDLLGIRINEFPYWILEMTNLKCLHLPDLRVTQQVDWGKIRCLPEQVNWEECGIFELEGTVTNSNRPFISVRGTNFFQFLEKNSTLRNTCFKRFHFSMYPPRKQGESGDIYHYRNDLDFREIYNKIRHLPDPGQPDRVPDPEWPDQVPDLGQPDRVPDHEQLDWSLEFYGFRSLCEYPREVIKRGNCISFIDDSCMSRLSDLGDDNLKALKDCWLERCHSIKCIFAGLDVTTLWVSNLPQLKSIYGETVQSKSQKNMKNLYIDCCPMLTGAFSSGQLPENLEVIQIKFCDKLETLIEHGTSKERTLPKLKTLHLLGLPMLKSIGLQLLKNLEIVQIQYCDKVETLFDHEAMRVCTLPKLHTLHLSELPFLKSIGISSTSQGACGVLECPNLKNLYIDFCPMLMGALSSGQLPENLEVIQIKFCDKLETLIEHEISKERTLPKLKTLHLLGLPMLKSIGLQLLENLEIVQIQYCDKVETLFDHEALRVCSLPKLHTLHLSELPFLKSIGVSCTSQGTSGGLECPNLKNLYIEFCPKIVSVFFSGQPLKSLEVVQIHHCDELKSLFKDKTSAEYVLPKLRTLCLVEMPKLESIGVSTAGSSLETDIRGCPNLKEIPNRQH